jgi:hypothetical protein
MNRLWLTLPIAMLLAGEAAAAPAMEYVPYRPIVGQTYTLFTKTKTVVTRGASAKTVAAYGDYQLKMTVIDDTADGYRMRWVLDSSIPNNPDGPKEGYIANSLYAKTLELHGVKSITVMTDKAGAPRSITEWPQIRQRLQATAEAQPAQAPLMRSLQTKFDASPAALMEALVPGAMLLTSFQGTERDKIAVGQPQVSPRPFQYAGVDVKANYRFEVEKVDRKARLVHFKYQLEVDENDFIRAAKASLESDAAALSESDRAALTPEQRESLMAATIKKSATGTMSLEDGRTTLVEETTAIRLGLTATTTTIRARMSNGRE